MGEDERSERLLKARICEQSERFEDMLTEMTSLVRLSTRDKPLSEQERNLLSVAYKNVVGGKRSSWRVLTARLDRETDTKHRDQCIAYRAKVEEELNTLCSQVLELLGKHLIPNASKNEDRIFYLKMKGDYYRYMVEICGTVESETKTELIGKAQDMYNNAMDIAQKELPVTSAIRLGLALNYSVFLYEIRGDPPKACELAKEAFDMALPELDQMAEEDYKDSSLILQLLRDNLTLWKTEMESEAEGEVEGEDGDK